MLKPNIHEKVRFTVDDLEKMIDAGVFVGRTGRIELIEGEFRKMSPASELHDNLIMLLTTWSVKQQTQNQYQIGVQMGLRLNETESMPEPDLFWVKTGNTKRPTTAVVPLVIEVAVSSIDYDRDVKSQLYAQDNLQEYWIVDAERHQIEVRRQPVGREFKSLQVYDRQRAVCPLCIPSAELDIDWLFRSAGV